MWYNKLDGGILMYKIGDLVVYENTGVCKVVDITEPEFIKPERRKLCYVLEPVFKKGTIYTPVDELKAFLRPVMNKEEALNTIDRILITEVEAYTGKKSQELEDKYKNAMKTHNCYDLMKLIMSIHIRKEESLANNKKISQVDDRYSKQVQDLIDEELSIALDIPKEEVDSFIEMKLCAKQVNTI